MVELFGIPMSWGYRGDRLGYWLENPYQEIFFVSCSRKFGTIWFTTSDGVDLTHESLESLWKRLGKAGSPPRC